MESYTVFFSILLSFRMPRRNRSIRSFGKVAAFSLSTGKPGKLCCIPGKCASSAAKTCAVFGWLWTPEAPHTEVIVKQVRQGCKKKHRKAGQETQEVETSDTSRCLQHLSDLAWLKPGQS